MGPNPTGPAPDNMVRMPKRAVALLLSSHPGPASVVSLVALLLGVVLQLPISGIVLLAAAVLAGQLSIGWSNDWLDAARDRAVSRTDKPVALGAVTIPAVRGSSFIAFGAMVVLSLLLGSAAGLVHIVAVASGWAYNLGVKNTSLSLLPYALSFGLLPGVATLARNPPALPAWWVFAAGALLGIAAHLTNVLPDLERDSATGIRGLPHRIGARASGYAAFALLGLVAVLLGAGTLSSGPATAATIVIPIAGIAIGIALTAIGVRMTAAGVHTRVLMRLVMAGALVDVVMLLGAGTALLA